LKSRSKFILKNLFFVQFKTKWLKIRVKYLFKRNKLAKKIYHISEIMVGNVINAVMVGDVINDVIKTNNIYIYMSNESLKQV